MMVNTIRRRAAAGASTWRTCWVPADRRRHWALRPGEKRLGRCDDHRPGCSCAGARRDDSSRWLRRRQCLEEPQSFELPAHPGFQLPQPAASLSSHMGCSRPVTRTLLRVLKNPLNFESSNCSPHLKFILQSIAFSGFRGVDFPTMTGDGGAVQFLLTPSETEIQYNQELSLTRFWHNRISMFKHVKYRSNEIAVSLASIKWSWYTNLS